MGKSSSASMLMTGAVLIVIGLLLAFTPIAKILGYVGIIAGAVLLVIALVRLFNK